MRLLLATQGLNEPSNSSSSCHLVGWQLKLNSYVCVVVSRPETRRAQLSLLGDPAQDSSDTSFPGVRDQGFP